LRKRDQILIFQKEAAMDELRKGIWNEAMWKAIGTFFSEYPNLNFPLTITCLDMTESTPLGQSGLFKIRTRLFTVLVEVDEKGSPAWNEGYYPEVFKGGPVVFLVLKGEDTYDLTLDLRFPGEHNDKKLVAEGQTAAV
jgi:hypothetical protein